jgi:malate dehydrogenase
MPVAAILGAGPIGAAIAHTLAERAGFRDIRLIDDQVDIAAGKALDIRQSGPLARFDVELSASADVLAAVGASVVILADPLNGDEWDGEAGLALVGRLIRAGTTAPLVFAGPKQTWLMERACAELHVPADRLVGAAPSALVGAVRALAGLEVDRSGADVQVAVVGRPPAFVIGWSAATISGSLATERIPAHRLLAISASLARLWPPGPQAIATAAAGVAEALVVGSRRLHQALTITDGELGVRGVAAMLPLELGHGRILQRLIPTLTPQERTALLNGVGGVRS